MATSRKSARKESEPRVKDLRIQATPEALAQAVVRGGIPKQGVGERPREPDTRPGERPPERPPERPTPTRESPRREFGEPGTAEPFRKSGPPVPDDPPEPPMPP